MNIFPTEELKDRIVELNEKYPFSSDEEFMSKLKLFYSNKEKVRVTGRTHALARVLLETAIESMQSIYLVDHHKIFLNSQQINRHLFRAIEDWQGYYYDLGIEIILRYESAHERFTAKLANAQSEKNYSLFKIKDCEFPKEKLKEFSKLLLIV